MKKVRYNSDRVYGNYDLTLGEVYDVIEFIQGTNISDNKIIILNDDNIEKSYYVQVGIKVFIDATAQYRSKIIDEILDYE